MFYFRLMFWADWGDPPKIERSSLSGSDRTFLVRTGLNQPVGLVIDYKRDRLYWVDYADGTINSVDLVGQKRRSHIHMHGAKFFGIAIYEVIH